MSTSEKQNIYKDVNDYLGTRYKSDQEIKWSILSIDYILGEDFIRKYLDYFKDYLTTICSNQGLSEGFIREHLDLILDWEVISRYQILSQGFIEEFEDKLDLESISFFQPFVDPEFLRIRSSLGKDYASIYLCNNRIGKLYQETKDRGWFIGYISNFSPHDFSLTIDKIDRWYFMNGEILNKAKIKWEDLILVYRAKKYEFIREIKYV